jgi:hypothetical protein
MGVLMVVRAVILSLACGSAKIVSLQNQRFADAHRQFEALAKDSGKLRVPDLAHSDIRQAVLGASSAKS